MSMQTKLFGLSKFLRVLVLSWNITRKRKLDEMQLL